MAIDFARGACVWNQGKYKDYVMTEDVSTTILARSDSANAVLIGVRVLGNYMNVEKGQGGKVVDINGIAPTVTENHGQVTGVVIEVGHLESGTGKHQSNTVVGENGICPALTTIQGGTQQVKVLVTNDEGENR